MIDWTPELKQEIVQRITSGESIRSIFASKHLPARSTFYVEQANHEEFRTAIARARLIGAAKEFDDFIALADEANETNANAIKVRLWARTWALSRLNPREYGDKITHAGDADNPIAVKRVVSDV